MLSAVDALPIADASEDAMAVAALLAIDGAALGGVVLRGAPGPARDAWLQWLRTVLPAAVPMRRIPLGIHDTALLGGLDLAATLHHGRPVAQPGVLPQADRGFVLLAMAERVAPELAARIAAVLDRGEVSLARDGLQATRAARVAVIALDEGLTDDEQVSPALRDRLAFYLDLERLRELPRWLEDAPPQAMDLARVRADLSRVRVDDASVQALCTIAEALGVASLRGPLLALRVARVLAALDAREAIDETDLHLAARLVLAPRATRLPQPVPPEDPPQEPADPPAEATQDPPRDEAPQPPTPQQVQEMAEQVLAAVQAALPRGLLLAQASAQAQRGRGGAGRAGAQRKTLNRGRPIGARRGEPRAGARLHVLDTLRAAAPWQALRKRQALAQDVRRIHVRREDFHITRYKQRSSTTAIFVVDASGSSALHRLAEAKGAVELMLAECYVRRDRVAVLAFRGAGVELLLPPTRSLARAKRSLAGLPGGGGTPLAGALDAAAHLVLQVRRAGDTPLLVVLTDGRANIARDGSPGRTRATEDAIAAARQLRDLGTRTLWIDTSAQPQAAALSLAVQAGARYLPLPHADAQALWTAVRGVAAQAGA